MGWYPDPTNRSAQRFWSGTSWTEWIYDGATVRQDRRPVRRQLRPDDVNSLEFVQLVFLPEVRAAGLVGDDESAAMADLARALIEEAVAPPPQPAGAAALGPPSPAAALEPAAPQPVETMRDVERGQLAPTRPEAAPQPTAPMPAPLLPPALEPSRRARRRPVRGPSRLATWWSQARAAVGSDLALHGLAYLGVLLLFVGCFGLVAFAFGEVAPTLRPLAELAIAGTPFAAASLLLHRGAVVAGRALELAGGLLLPIMAITSFLDGVDVPRDLTGTALVVTSTAVVGSISAGYAVWSMRHPRSALRYLVAPLA